MYNYQYLCFKHDKDNNRTYSLRIMLMKSKSENTVRNKSLLMKSKSENTVTKTLLLMNQQLSNTKTFHNNKYLILLVICST